MKLVGDCRLWLWERDPNRQVISLSSPTEEKKSKIPTSKSRKSKGPPPPFHHQRPTDRCRRSSRRRRHHPKVRVGGGRLVNVWGGMGWNGCVVAGVERTCATSHIITWRRYVRTDSAATTSLLISFFSPLAIFSSPFWGLMMSRTESSWRNWFSTHKFALGSTSFVVLFRFVCLQIP